MPLLDELQQLLDDAELDDSQLSYLAQHGVDDFFQQWAAEQQIQYWAERQAQSGQQRKIIAALSAEQQPFPKSPEGLTLEQLDDCGAITNRDKLAGDMAVLIESGVVELIDGQKYRLRQYPAGLEALRQLAGQHRALEGIIDQLGYYGYLQFTGRLALAWQQAREAVGNNQQQLALVDRIFYCSWPGSGGGNDQQPGSGAAPADLLFGDQNLAAQSADLQRQLAVLVENKVIHADAGSGCFSLLPDLSGSAAGQRYLEAPALTYFSPEYCWQQLGRQQSAANYARQNCDDHLQLLIVDTLIARLQLAPLTVGEFQQQTPVQQLEEFCTAAGYDSAAQQRAHRRLVSKQVIKFLNHADSYRLFEYDSWTAGSIDSQVDAQRSEKLAALRAYGPTNYYRRQGAVHQLASFALAQYRQLPIASPEPAIILLSEQALRANPEPLTTSDLAADSGAASQQLISDLQPLVDVGILSTTIGADGQPNYRLAVEDYL